MIYLLDSVGFELVAEQESFAFSISFSLYNNNTQLTKQLKTISELQDYMQPIFLAAFEVEAEIGSYSQTFQNMDFQKDEEIRLDIFEKSKESIDFLQKYDGFRGDKRFSSQAGQLLRFYQTEAKTTFI